MDKEQQIAHRERERRAVLLWIHDLMNERAPRCKWDSNQATVDRVTRFLHQVEQEHIEDSSIFDHAQFEEGGK